jgi:phenylalanyl-tRNA synthetase beta chain
LPKFYSLMIISYQWLMEYLPVGQAGLPEPLPVNELSRILTSIGLEVEAVEPMESIPGGLQGLVIGEVLTCAKHPNADKLSVTTVNIGAEAPLQIVCGAPNVAAGQRVVVAPVGTSVHPTEGEPFLIKKAKIRGEESAGMICAEDEIGLGKSHAGIMILPADAPIGMTAREYFKIPQTDFAIHIGLTPNRSDANSHIGVARDVCAYLTHHKPETYRVVMPADMLQPPTAASPIKVTVEALDACPRYTGINLSKVKIGPSPEWLQQRLQTIGVRSINNIVDITNYVLHEYGQPLHAFDADKLKGNKIIVRFMTEGSVFKALDDKERKLQATDLMICDAEGPVAMGGVFGGKDSGISDGTTNVFLESAYFNSKHIRRTSTHHGLRTDAAMHFEKGVDINNVIPALKRAAALIVALAGAEVTSAIVDEYPIALKPVTVTVSYTYIHKLSGKNYSKAAIQELLVASGFEITSETDTELTLRVPTNKTDVSQPADIVEEILRIDGLDNIGMPERMSISMTKSMPTDRELREHYAELLCGMGFQEIVTNSIVNGKFYPDRTDLVRMINSLSSELDVMRPSMLESGLEVVAYNCNRKNQNICLFEFGNIYAHREGKYIQDAQLGLWLTGDVRAASWDGKPAAANIFYLKGVIGNLLNYGGITNAVVSVDEHAEGIEIVWKWKNVPLCRARAVTTKCLSEFDIKQPVFFAEIDWAQWSKAFDANKIKYKEVPKFPAVQRDLAIVLDTNVTYAQVQEATDKLKIDSLQSYGLFDVFESDKLGKGKKSYALNYTFQLHDRTLTDAEIEQSMKQLMDTYKTKLSAQIRG